MRTFLRVIVGVFAMGALQGCSLRWEASPSEGTNPATLTPAEWVSLGKPGASHQLLETFVGTWDVAITFWPAPDAQPELSTGHSTVTWILGSRFIQERFNGSAAGEGYAGIGMMGFDNGARLFTAVWMDSLNTSMAVSTGRYNAETSTLSFQGEVYDPLLGRGKETRTEIKIISPDQYEISMMNTSPNGKRFRSLQMVYHRRKLMCGGGRPLARSKDA